MKKRKKIFSKVMMVGVIASTLCVPFSGCGEIPDIVIDEQEQVDTTRTQLYVGVHDGALGYEWLKEYKVLYEEANPDVQIIIDNKKDYDSTLSSSIGTARQSLYFLAQNHYNEFVSKGLAEDITDVINEKCYDNNMNYVGENGSKSILDSMWQSSRDEYVVDGKYYAIPNWLSPTGIFYDADLFEEKGYTVPETYNELIALMNQMVVDDITPFTFSSMAYIYANALESVWASYEGAANFALNNTFSGTDSKLGEITLANGNILQKQEGKRAALKFAYDLMKNKSYTTDKTRSGGLNNEIAQQDFVKSINPTDSKTNRVAMFMEMSYWEPEVADYMNKMGQINPAWSYGRRNFKYMPFPKFVGVDGIIDQTNDKNTILHTSSYSFVCINKAKSQAEKDLAKDFLKFVQGRQCLAIYTKYTSCIRPFDFKMTDSEYNECTTLGKQVYDMANDENFEVVTNGSVHPFRRSNTDHWMFNWAWATTTSVAAGSGAFFTFYTNPTLTVDMYFNGLSTYWNDTMWANSISNFL